MKITPYKIARVKMSLPPEDREQIEKEMAQEGGISSELMSTIAKNINYFAPKRLKKTKGAFGHKGLNRKVAKRLQRIQNIIAAQEAQAKKEEAEKNED